MSVELQILKFLFNKPNFRDIESDSTVTDVLSASLVISVPSTVGVRSKTYKSRSKSPSMCLSFTSLLNIGDRIVACISTVIFVD